MSRCEKTRYWRSGFFGKLTGLTACVSPFMIDHFTNRLQVFLHSVWTQDVLDRAMRINYRSRDVPKVVGKGTNNNFAKAR